MSVRKLPGNFDYLTEMYEDDYFPNFLVDQLKDSIRKVVSFIEEGNHTKVEIQEALDKMTLKTNELQEAFEENDSELETVARDSIGITVENILKYFGVDIDIEEAIREREW